MCRLRSLARLLRHEARSERRTEKSVLSPRARIIHEHRREAFETEARRSLSQVMPTEAYLQSVEESERAKPRRERESDDVAGIHE